MTGPRKPLIGVTTYLEPASWGIWVREAALLPASYLRSVERSGGIPVLLPPLESLAGIDGLLAALDGIIIAGGPDVDPVLYGAERHEATGSPHPRRDRFELGLVRAVIEADLPFLAICRGMQLLNVARGGQLIQHLPDVVAHDGHAPNPGRFAKHRVQISATSAIGKLLGEVVDVPTYHHQAVQRLGKGLVAVAWAKDQVVEALELQGHRFGLAVQWHPEEGDDLRLFEALIEEALTDVLPRLKPAHQRGAERRVGHGEVHRTEFFSMLGRLNFSGIMTVCVFAWGDRARESCVFNREQIAPRQ